MERFFFDHLIMISLLGIALLSFLAVYAWRIKSESFFISKAKSNKLLLRKLLEGFGLEIPSELQEQTTAFIKQ